MSARPRVAVVFGGRSPEHPISCLTAGTVMTVLDRERYDVVAVGVTRAGRWVVGSDPQDMAPLGADGLPEVTPTDAHETTPPGQPPALLSEVDVVVPLLHGAYGEDGTVQGLLEVADVRYVGSGVLASAVAMDKAVMKTLLAAAGVPVCRWVTLTLARWAADPAAVTSEVGALGWPVFVKPARAGSSFGITKVTSPDGLAAAIAHAGEFDPKIVVEEAVVGREVECGVLDDPDGGPPQVSVLGEVLVGGDHEFYDFEAKYTDGDALTLVIPADVDSDVLRQLKHLAPAAFAALSCEGLARVDFFLTEDGRLVLNEVNTMPGFTPSSMFPRLWAASGIDYAGLVDRLVTTALRRPLGLR
ncbi:MAG: D-alanine--D-alanine ligase family protein [Jiangellales bacterium]